MPTVHQCAYLAGKGDYILMDKNDITPLEFETLDGRINVKCSDEDYLELSIIEDYSGAYEKSVERIEFHKDDLETIIAILIKARDINCKTWESIKKWDKDCK
jgi:hypothetical protein